jgi:hypothetical protein
VSDELGGIEQREHPLRAVAAAGTHHGGYGAVQPGVPEVRGTHLVLAGQIIHPDMALQCRGADLDVETPAAKDLHPLVEPVGVAGTGRRDHRHPITR